MKKSGFDPQIFLAALRNEAGEASRPLAPRFLRRLLRLEGEEFIHQAYLAFLERRADDVGLNANLTRSRHYLGRIKIILILLLSQERREMARRGLRR